MFECSFSLSLYIDLMLMLDSPEGRYRHKKNPTCKQGKTFTVISLKVFLSQDTTGVEVKKFNSFVGAIIEHYVTTKSKRAVVVRKLHSAKACVVDAVGAMIEKANHGVF